ncbi:MAG: hypothetical protein IPL32_06945 [Chloracidobacterium sp.]|nr:hypothetical protein [Chloracidobacterium sp.]
MKKITYRFSFILILACAAGLVGCSGGTDTTANTSINTNNTNVPPPVTANWKKDVTPADIARIKWLEGTWRGSGEGEEGFYERYKFEDTSLIVESFEDATLKTVKDRTRYALVNGEFRFTTTDARRVAASEITDDHIQFVPIVGEGNSYRFERQPGGKWRAVLEWKATADKPAKQTIYMMEPYKK